MKRVKILLLSFVVSCSFGSLMSQTKRWSRPEIMLQSRLYQKPSQMESSLDFGVGVRWNYQLAKRLRLNVGTSLNYARFRTAEPGGDVPFVGYVKGTRIDYFLPQSATQFSLETPLSMHFDLFEKNGRRLSLIGGVTPQLLLGSRAQGIGLDGNKAVNSSIFQSQWTLSRQAGNINGDRHYIFNDAYLNVGLRLENLLENNKSVIFEAGYEYSPVGKTGGLFLRTGLRF